MEFKCKLVEKTFTDKERNNHTYYALVFKLNTGDELEVTIKSDKAKLLKLSNSINIEMPDKKFWEDE